MNQLNLDAVSKEEMLQALMYMSGQYITSNETNDLEHQFMYAGEYTCEVLAKVGVIVSLAYGGKWLVNPWIKLDFKEQCSVDQES